MPKIATLGLYAALNGIWLAGSLWLPNGHIREVLIVLWLLLTPGYVLWRALTGDTARLTYKLGGYVIGLSLLFLMLLGLLLNQIYTFVGASHPFNRLPLTVAVSIAVLIASVVAAARAQKVPVRPVSLKQLLKSVKHVRHKSLTCSVIVAGLLLPLFAVAGATTLNNGGSAGLAIVGMCFTAGFFALLLVRERDLAKYYGYALYCICVSILFATSMRGWNITGHDVMEEYQVFQLTLSHAAWHMSYYHDAYTACLSITILPTIFQKLSGIYAPYVFKFLFQAIFALVAVVLYGTLRAYANRRVALLAVFLFITFPTFITDMAMLNRQEIGLLFLALVLHAGTNKQLNQWIKSVLVFLFMVGMILSHYSTSYVTIGALLIALGLGCVWTLATHRLPQKHKYKTRLDTLTSIVSPMVIVASTLVLIGWGAIATQTSNNITQTFQAITATIHGTKLASSTLLTQKTTPISQFTTQAEQTRKLPASSYYPSKTTAKYPVQSAKESIAPESSFLRALSIPVSALQAVYNIMRSAYALLIEGCVSLGLVYCLLKKRTAGSLPRQYLLMATGMMVIVGLQIVLPAAINYGLTRILQQELLVLALPCILVALQILRLVRIPHRLAEVLTGGVLIAFFLVLSGTLSAITGGYKPSLQTANSGFYYEAYYTHQDEIAAANWLHTEPPKGSQVYSDEFMRRKLITYGDIFSQSVLVPSAIPIDSYVVLSHGNLEFNQVPAYVPGSGSLIYYKPPTAFLQTNKNLIYSSGDVEIYK